MHVVSLNGTIYDNGKSIYVLSDTNIAGKLSIEHLKPPSNLIHYKAFLH